MWNKAGLAGMGLVAALAASPAQADDLSTYLKGRWGLASTNWTLHEPRRSYHACGIEPGSPDTAIRFAGPLGKIMVTTDARKDSPGPLTAPLVVGQQVRYDPNQHSGHLAAARMIVEVSFSRRGMFGTTVAVKGLMGMIGPDRFVIVEPSRTLYPYYLMRCPA